MSLLDVFHNDLGEKYIVLDSSELESNFYVPRNNGITESSCPLVCAKLCVHVSVTKIPSRP